ncbi:MAG TPA: hypothetical protein VML55_02065 [Planctomycetaceae bacterium]|nr:hypothetical protein [Planctomycetaceae bacterium]
MSAVPRVNRALRRGHRDLGQWPEPPEVVAPFEREMHEWFGAPDWFQRGGGAAAAMELLAQEGYDPVYGARPLKPVIQQRIQNELAHAMLEGRFAERAVIRVDAAADGFVFGEG